MRIKLYSEYESLLFKVSVASVLIIQGIWQVSLLFKVSGKYPYYSRYLASVLIIQGIWQVSLLFKVSGKCPYYSRNVLLMVSKSIEMHGRVLHNISCDVHVIPPASAKRGLQW